jgi:hypothetical protein
LNFTRFPYGLSKAQKLSLDHVRLKRYLYFFKGSGAKISTGSPEYSENLTEIIHKNPFEKVIQKQKEFNETNDNFGLLMAFCVVVFVGAIVIFTLVSIKVRRKRRRNSRAMLVRDFQNNDL